MFYQIVYTSSATFSYNLPTVLEILNEAQTRNAQLGVTGYLSYQGNDFFQYLEGERDKVDFLYEKISKDSRHSNMEKVYEGQCQEKLFPDWKMGFSDKNLNEERKLSFLKYSLSGVEIPDKLLSSNNPIINMIKRFEEKHGNQEA